MSDDDTQFPDPFLLQRAKHPMMQSYKSQI